MMPGSGEGHGLRKSVNPFSRSKLSGLTTPLNTKGKEGEKTETKKLAKRSSLFHHGSSIGTETHHDRISSTLATERPASPSTRSRTLHKGNPSSKFGSLGRKSILSLDEESVDGNDIAVSPPSESSFEDQEHRAFAHGRNILYHGEVQTTIGLFRKKKEYLVLTDDHLIRFKSQSRALEIFPTMSHQIITRRRSSAATRHASTASIGSMQDLQSLNSRSSTENENSMSLCQIVAVYRVEDGRPFFITEVVYLDEETNTIGSVQLMLQDPNEADVWHTSIRGAAQKAKLVLASPFPNRIVSYLVRVLEAAQDYDGNHFKIFRVVRRLTTKSTGKPSSDDLSKINSSVSYLVIGINKIHLVSMPDFSEPSAKAIRTSFGLVTLTSMNIKHSDDSFELIFRIPLQQPTVLSLAASSSPEIGTIIFRAILYLKPQWLDYTFLFSGLPNVLDDGNVLAAVEEDSGGFDRTLVAYCLAYGCHPYNIRYTIDYEAEDAPEFLLLPPAEPRSYTVLELLAIFRALRYNESFHSISFNNINLQSLHGRIDLYGVDHVAWTSRSGIPIKKYFNIIPEGRSLLYQEVQALALKTNRVRRMNFGGTLPRRRPKDMYEEEGAAKDPGCEIAAAILPLCRGQLTNVDWIVFSGIELGETDLEELVPALDERMSHLRCIEVSRCGLSDRGLQVFLNHLEKQNATMECINISDNPGRLHLDKFPMTMSRFSQIRKLDLSRATSTSGSEPLIAAEVMLAWHLQELVLTGVPVNDRTLDAIAIYVNSDMSNSLQLLQMDQCNLTGAHVALLMRSMCQVPGKARNMHLHISANRLEKGNDEIVKAIEDCVTPSHLTMRMVEYQTESRFRQLLEALRKNSTIRSLDISKASLPYDAGDETCLALQHLFEENTTLEELDISGEHAHLEIARFGIGLSSALNGLKKNKALKVLKIEYQNLGLEGANTLSSVLENNETLTHIHCEHNDINLQGFTVLVNSLATNFTVLHLPLMLDDQNEAIKRMKAVVSDSKAMALKSEHGVKNSVRKTLTTFGVHVRESPLPTPQDVDEAVRILHTRWSRQTERLVGFLQRNLNIAQGIETRSIYEGDNAMTGLMRPHTAMSDGAIAESVLRNTTPRIERTNPIDSFREVERVERVEKADKLSILEEIDGDVEDDTFSEQMAKLIGRGRSMSELTAKVGKFELGDAEKLEK